VLGELVAVLELELLGPALLHRHGQHEAGLPGRPGHVGAEFLVDQDAQPPGHQRGVAQHPPGRGEDQHLGLAHGRELVLGRLVVLHPEQAAERVALVHRHDEQRLRRGWRSGDVGHGRLPSVSPSVWVGPYQASIRAASAPTAGQTFRCRRRPPRQPPSRFHAKKRPANYPTDHLDIINRS
jgi:hypothetical protein